MRVSVVIPAYNGEKWIRGAVESALSQTLIAEDGLPERYEVIVRDDGSTDGTWAILEELHSQWPGKIKLWRSEVNEGLVTNFQKAMDMASSEFVTILGQDDLLDPDYLSTVLKAFTDDVAMVSCRQRFIDGEGKPFTDANDRRLGIPKPQELPRDQMKQSLRMGNMHFGLNTHRRSCFAEVGGFDPKAGWLLDWDLYLSYLAKWEIRIVDKELCSMALRADCTSALRLDQMPEQHRYAKHIQRKHFRPTKMKLGIATPFYMSQEYSHYGESLLYTCRMLTQAGVDWELIRVNGDSYVDRAKNTLWANFLESDCTDLLMIDSDMQWHPLAVSRLLQHPQEIVAGAYPFKNNWGAFAGNPLIKDGKYDGLELTDGSCLLKAYNIAGGFLRVKRSAIEKFQDFFPNDIYLDDYAWPGRPGRIYDNFFQCDVRDCQRYGEDASFSRRCHEAGIDIWIDPNINFTHWGVKGWDGNLHERLLKPHEQIEREKAEMIKKVFADKAQEEVTTA